VDVVLGLLQVLLPDVEEAVHALVLLLPLLPRLLLMLQ